MHYHPLTATDKQEMLKEIGVGSFEDLLACVPSTLRNPKMSLPEALSEAEIQACFRDLGRRNENVITRLSFLGGGSYEHFIPAAVHSIVGRHEFYTAYTPYQAEASQGTLQTIFEFQSLVTELMGLDVSNASHYDGATSMSEAVLMALRHTGRKKVLVARSVHPHYRQVLTTYLQGTEYSVQEIGFDDKGQFDSTEFQQLLTDEVACAVFQSPNFLGTIENLEGIADKVHARGALFILDVNPLSLGILRSPGEWNADIAVAEGQPLGIPLQFGGPYLGLFATTRALMRRMPGRVVGLTVDAQGRRAYCLTMQAREQHIRREKASSNICSNQALCALAACAYMTLMGKQGIREVGEINLDRSAYLRGRIAELKGFKVNLSQPIFNEFFVTAETAFSDIEKKLLADHILPGIDLGKHYPEIKNSFLVCATETKSKKDLDRFVEMLAKC